MTVSQAITRLIAIREKDGNVEIFFDCPKCGTVTAPDLLEVVVKKTTAVLSKLL